MEPQHVEFAVTPVPHGSSLLLQVSGELDLATAPALRSAVAHALGDHPATLLVDLSGTSFIDSTGCRELVRAVKSGTAGGVGVEVVAPPDNWPVRRVLDVVQLSAVVPVHDDVPAP